MDKQNISRYVGIVTHKVIAATCKSAIDPWNSKGHNELVIGKSSLVEYILVDKSSSNEYLEGFDRPFNPVTFSMDIIGTTIKYTKNGNYYRKKR